MHRQREDQAIATEGRGWTLAAEALLLGLALLMLAGGILGPERVLAHSYFWAPADGNQIYPKRMVELLWLCRIGCAAALIAIILIWWQRQAVGRALAGTASQFLHSLRELLRSTRRELTSLPAVAWVSLAILTVIGIAVRVRYLFEPLRYDEAFTYALYAARPVRAFLQDYSYPNNHVFHTILVHFSTRFFGPAPWAIRLPAFVAGVLTIPTSGFLFRRLFNLPAAMLAAALAAGSWLLIEYSVNGRGYSIQVLIFLLMLALALYLRRRASLAGWAMMTVLAAIGFYTIPTMLYPFGVVLGWLILLAVFEPVGPSPRRTLRAVMICGIATVLLTIFLYSPILLYHGPHPLLRNQYVAPLSRSQWVHGLPLALKHLWTYANRGLPLAVALPLALGVALYIVLAKREQKRQVLLLIVAVLWCPLLVAVQRVIPFTRVWIFLEPLYLALAAAGYVALVERSGAKSKWASSWTNIAIPAAVLIVVAAFVIRSRTIIQTGEECPHALDLAQFLNGELRSGDRLATAFPSEMPLRYWGLQYPKIPAAMARTNSASNRVIAVVRLPTDPEDVTKSLVHDFDQPRQVYSVPGFVVYELRRRHG